MPDVFMAKKQEKKNRKIEFGSDSNLKVEIINRKGDTMSRKQTYREQQKERDDLTGEHTVTDVGQIILACLFAAMWIPDTFFLKYTTVLNGHVPPGIRIPFGVVLLVISSYLASKGLSIVFGEKREKPSVIRKGVFNVVRHPIYLSEILLYLGFLMLSISLAALFVLVIAILFLHYISRCEERLLLARFGEEYRKYMQEVPMWIPRLRKR
jgi:protein-S-isoprenylcysteine O-methyltransferase Ste14